MKLEAHFWLVTKSPEVKNVGIIFENEGFEKPNVTLAQKELQST
jgi:hypothetical protein